MRSRSTVEVVLHDTGLHTSRPRDRVDLEDLVHVARHVEDDRLADRLSAVARARAARQDRDTEPVGDPDRRDHVLRMTRRDHTDRIDRVHARIGAVEMTRVGVEPDVTGDL